MNLRSLLHLDRRPQAADPGDCEHETDADGWCWNCFFEEVGVSPAGPGELDDRGVELDPVVRPRWA
jgi:hypothetical protein